MSKKKGHKPSELPLNRGGVRSPGNPMTTWLVVAVVAIAVIGAVSFLSRGGISGAAGPKASPSAPANSAGLVAPAEEAKYIGRFLPRGYQEASVTAPGAVSVDTPMTPATAAVESAGLAVALTDITSKRNVSFEYRKSDGTAVPLIAFVKPSGKIFVGVSYCVPCKGTGQTLTADGQLTCTSCGTKRDPETGIGVSGACRLYPLDELPATIQGEKLVVDRAALDGWTQQPLDRQVGG
jgi:hypothetical protein